MAHAHEASWCPSSIRWCWQVFKSTLPARGRYSQPSGCSLLTVLRDVIHEERADSAAVVGAGDGAVPLLACCVPDLRLNGLAIHLCAAGQVLNSTSRGLKRSGEDHCHPQQILRAFATYGLAAVEKFTARALHAHCRDILVSPFLYRIYSNKATHLNAASGKLDADGGLGLQAELIARESRQQIGFADAAVSDQHHLEQVVIAAPQEQALFRQNTCRWPGEAAYVKSHCKNPDPGACMQPATWTTDVQIAVVCGNRKTSSQN